MMKHIRSLIFGNSGSGKSWLAEQMARIQGIRTIDLDSIHWESGGFNMARDKALAVRLVQEAAQAGAWVIEGVYG